MSKFWIAGCWRACLINCVLYGAATADGLGDALQATMQNHPAVAGQLAQVEAKRQAADAVRSQRYPTITAQAEQYREGGRAPNGEDLSQPYALRVRQPIWAFGRIDNNIAAANAEVSTVRADSLRVRRQLLEETAMAYATVRGTQQQIDIAERNVAQLENLFAQIERRVTGQLASQADAHLAAARLSDARAELERTISEREGAQDDLVGFTQVPVNADEPVPGDLLDLHEAPDVIEQAIDENAEIRVKRSKVEQSELEVERARTASMPTIYLQADRYYDQPGLNDDSQAGVVFEASLEGLGFASKGRVGEAAASHVAATQDLAAAKVDVAREIKQLERRRRLQTHVMELQIQSVSDLESLLGSYERQYDSGTKSWLDLLNIQRELFEQRRQLVQAQTDWQVYTLQLLARIGSLDSLAGLRSEH